MFLAKLQAVIMAALGLVAGILYSFGGLIMDALVSAGWLDSSSTSGLSLGTLLAFGALVGMPALFAIAGFAAGAIGATLFNIVAPWFGGIQSDGEV